MRSPSILQRLSAIRLIRRLIIMSRPSIFDTGTVAVHIGSPSPEFHDWARTHIFYHHYFTRPSSLVEHEKLKMGSPTFSLLGHAWTLDMNDWGRTADDKPIYLELWSEYEDDSITVEWNMYIKDVNGNQVASGTMDVCTVSPKSLYIYRKTSRLHTCCT